MTLRVLHLVGSAVSEFMAELSQLYARDCLDATADPARYEFHLAYISPDGRWRFPTGLSPVELAAVTPMPVADAIRTMVELDLDVVVPQMFCHPGMTTYRALFDLLGIPYVGNTPDVMALGADKAKAKAVVAAAGVRVPAGEVLHRGDRPTLSPPVVVKPLDGDNSVGLTLVRAEHDFDAALEAAFEHSDRVLVESYVELGREVRCGAIERDGQLVFLPLEEYDVDAATKPIRDYADKISRGHDGGLNLVAKDGAKAWIVDPADPVTERVWAAARECHIALGCRHYSLFDFRIDAEGEPWFLEAGLYCSFAHQSVIPTMARAAGLGVQDLFRTAISAALSG